VTPHTSRNCLTFPVLVRLKSSPPTKENWNAWRKRQRKCIVQSLHSTKPRLFRRFVGVSNGLDFWLIEVTLEIPFKSIRAELWLELPFLTLSSMIDSLIVNNVKRSWRHESRRQMSINSQIKWLCYQLSNLHPRAIRDMSSILPWTTRESVQWRGSPRQPDRATRISFLLDVITYSIDDRTVVRWAFSDQQT
jgi:hypothetical protein